MKASSVTVNRYVLFNTHFVFNQLFPQSFRPERFKPSTVVHSGVNPLGSFASFMNKDAIKNIDIRRDDHKEDARVA